ncbi:hypothetical protein SAMN04488039_101120 [Sulfitobacter dubius]|nr:hypothetical protein SAMN04488039_101120 [Sulfitobacter dubius]
MRPVAHFALCIAPDVGA